MLNCVTYNHEYMNNHVLPTYHLKVSFIKLCVEVYLAKNIELLLMATGPTYIPAFAVFYEIDP